MQIIYLNNTYKYTYKFLLNKYKCTLLFKTLGSVRINYNNIVQYCCFYCISDQMNIALGSIRHFCKKTLQSFIPKCLNSGVDIYNY